METNGNFRDENDSHRHHNLKNNRALIGLILVLVGFFLVMRNTGIIPDFIDNVVFSWPMILVAVGLVLTLGNTEKTAGVIIMAVGGFFLIPHIFRDTFHVYNIFWPSVFIIVGIIFIVSRRRNWHPGVSRGVVGDDFIDYVNIFSGGERQVVSDNFKGGKITAIFGGMELDVTKAKLAPGKSVLEIAFIFGGATIIVPDDWYISIEVTPILGGFSDSRKLTPGRSVDPSKHLIIKGAVVFGGGEIKSY